MHARTAHGAYLSTSKASVCSLARLARRQLSWTTRSEGVARMTAAARGAPTVALRPNGAWCAQTTAGCNDAGRSRPPQRRAVRRHTPARAWRTPRGPRASCARRRALALLLAICRAAAAALPLRPAWLRAASATPRAAGWRAVRRAARRSDALASAEAPCSQGDRLRYHRAGWWRRWMRRWWAWTRAAARGTRAPRRPMWRSARRARRRRSQRGACEALEKNRRTRDPLTARCRHARTHAAPSTFTLEVLGRGSSSFAHTTAAAVNHAGTSSRGAGVLMYCAMSAPPVAR